MNAEYIDIIKKAFPDVLVEKEGDRVLINHFLAIEPASVNVVAIGRSRVVPGYLATLDDGEDAVELYKGTNFWLAIEQCAVELAKFNIRVLRDRIEPFVIPCGNY